MRFRVGKLPQGVLERLLREYSTLDERVVVGPKVGEDCAVVDFGEKYLVVKTDPITFATEDIAWYVVNINANDVATMGARPRWFLCTALLPEGVGEEEVEALFASLKDAAEELGVSLCGGHTEITYGLERPILVGQMLGEVEREKLVRSDGARPGDVLLLTKGLAIEATALLAREFPEKVRGAFGEEFLERCRNYLRDPGLSVVPEALAACGAGRVHAMHDPTEGGVATGLRELAHASGVGMEVWEEGLFVSEETRAICGAFGVDPLGAISSGALLIAVDPEDAPSVREAVSAMRIRCKEIGVVRESSFGVKLRREGRLLDLPEFGRDEVAKLFERGEARPFHEGRPMACGGGAQDMEPRM
ncbi:MAG: hydrogenase expression/formation protein [Candidatus Latescibacterota bacterium]|nr:MAG: hydrogenase expression/formation protein [Candidatus Latescibacterota bacterium]